MNSNFPHAPSDWTTESATNVAKSEQMELTDDHWDLVKALHEFFAKHPNRINFRELHDALDEHFHSKGGVKYLYSLLPGGPVTQGCRLAGLQPPSGSVDEGFGSVF